MNKGFPSYGAKLLIYNFSGIFLISLGVSAVPLVLEGVKPSADMYHFLFYVTEILDKESLREILLVIFTEPWARLYST